MLTAYAKMLRAERSAGEDNNSVVVQFLLHYHKTCLYICACVFLGERKGILVCELLTVCVCSAQFCQFVPNMR